MRHHAVPLLLLLAFLGSRATVVQVHERNLKEVIKDSSGAVVLIATSDGSGSEIAQGSGFIISSDGKIVTNYHVIRGAHAAVVKLSNGAFFPVEGVLVTDIDRDLAIIKVLGKNLPILSLADSDKLEIGEHVVAIGSPLGLQNSASDGIVSGLREETVANVWIQTTVPVSPGNSGGPLLKMDGSVVGIITWGVKIGQNLNFAIPVNEVTKLLATSSKVVPLSQQLGTVPATQSSEIPNAPNLPSERVWTSMTSGRDYKVRFDGDYMYTEWVNLPAQLQGTAAFARSELKKIGSGWGGKSRTYLPCQYWDKWKTGQWQVRWQTQELESEITAVSSRRIEGRAQIYAAGFDCKKGQPKGSPEWQSFTWIPKD